MRGRLVWDAVLPLFNALGALCAQPQRRHLQSSTTRASCRTSAATATFAFCAIVLRTRRRPRLRPLALSRRRLRLPETRAPRHAASGDERRRVAQALSRRRASGFPSARGTPATSSTSSPGRTSPASSTTCAQFVDTIEGELRECSSMLGSCSERWRDMPLPDRIDRSNIHSQGYKYGDHRFTLDRDQVLQPVHGRKPLREPVRVHSRAAAERDRCQSLPRVLRAQPRRDGRFARRSHSRRRLDRSRRLPLDPRRATSAWAWTSTIAHERTSSRSASPTTAPRAFHAHTPLRHGKTPLHPDHPLRHRRALLLRHRRSRRGHDASRERAEATRQAHALGPPRASTRCRRARNGGSLDARAHR